MSVDPKKLAEHQEAILHAPEKEEMVAEAMQTPIQQSLPVTWQDSSGKHHLKGSDANIKVAGENEIAQYGFAPARVCGTCKYFDLNGNARRELVKQNFAQRLVFEEKWKLSFLGVPLDNLGLCGASNGERATTSISNASGCDQYRPMRYREFK